MNFVSGAALVIMFSQISDGGGVVHQLTQGVLERPFNGDSSDSVVVGTEWLKLHKATIQAGTKTGANVARIGDRANEFLGFVRGRLRTSPPDWWCDELRRGRITSEGDGVFRARKIVKRWRLENEWMLSGCEDIRVVSDSLSIKCEATVTRLKRSEYMDVDHPAGAWENGGVLAAACRSGALAVVFESPKYSVAPERRLFFVDSASGKPVWTNSINSGVRTDENLSGGYWGSFTAITMDDSRIMVWIGNDASMSFNMFQKCDGKLIATFSTDELERSPDKTKVPGTE